MRQTGGRSVGATSTRASWASRAMSIAWAVGTKPNRAPSAAVSPLGLMRDCSVVRGRRRRSPQGRRPRSGRQIAGHPNREGAARTEGRQGAVAEGPEGQEAGFLKLVEPGRVPRGSFLIIENLDRLSREHIQPARLL